MAPVKIEDKLDKMDFSHDTKYYELKFEVPDTSEDFSASTLASSSVKDGVEKNRLVEIVKLIVDKKSKTFSNNHLKETLDMGYTVANRYMKPLEDLGIISKLRPGTKLARTVDLDKATEYLQSITQNHEVQNQLSPESSVPSDTEKELTSTEDNVGETRTVQEQQKESNSDGKISSTELNRIAKNLSEHIKKHGSNRTKRKKGAAH